VEADADEQLLKSLCRPDVAIYRAATVNHISMK